MGDKPEELVSEQEQQSSVEPVEQEQLWSVLEQELEQQSSLARVREHC